MFVFKSFILFVSLSLNYKSDCDLLPNGKYLVHYSMPRLHPLPDDFYLIVNRDGFIQYGDRIDTAKGKIRWLYGCGFILDIKPKPVVDSNVVYTFGESFFELKKGKKDTMNFRVTYTGNLHVTVYTGTIIQVE